MVNSLILPWLLSTSLLGEFDRPTTRLLDQDFGVGLRPEQLLLSRYGYYLPSLRDRLSTDIYYRPWADLLRQEGGGISSVSLDKDAFKVNLDVQQFKPEEIEVKIVDKYIMVTAKHEEKKDEHGLISRQFVRRYAIPEGVDPDTITSSISSDGILMIQAPVKEQPEDKNVRKLKIELTGKPALKPKEEEKKEETTTTSTPTSSSTTTEESTITSK